MFSVLSCICLCPIYWSHVLSLKWRCSRSSADRWCSNYIWVINNLIAPPKGGERFDSMDRIEGPITRPLYICRPRRFHKKWNGAKWPSSCGGTASTRIWLPHRPMTMPLHIYGPRRFHKTWDGANLSRGCGVTVPGRIWNSLKGLKG